MPTDSSLPAYSTFLHRFHPVAARYRDFLLLQFALFLTPVFSHKICSLTFCGICILPVFQLPAYQILHRFHTLLPDLMHWRQKAGFIIAECKRFSGVFVVAPVKCPCVMRLASNINSNDQSFFSYRCNFLVLCVILHYRYLSVQ